jgi:putative glutamine amidotransferase
MSARRDGRPIIGITVDLEDARGIYASSPAYAASVEKAGGLPILLAYKTNLALIPQIVDLLDGILFSGGNDLDPALYGETLHPKAIPIDPDRQRFELALMAEVERRRTPALGICLGSQLMNVYRGGSLHQFLPETQREPMLEHRKVGEVVPRHEVQLDRESVVAKTLGKSKLDANSYHKQSVKRGGRGLRIIGTSPDGVVEGIEDPTLPLFLGVQWHPERLHEEADHLSLFRLLVEKAAKAKQA